MRGKVWKELKEDDWQGTGEVREERYEGSKSYEGRKLRKEEMMEEG